ncbi:MAG: AEC family transporter [Clostridia bacterium]|nr:AEC family transporter [Clostridia bacterium]
MIGKSEIMALLYQVLILVIMLIPGFVFKKLNFGEEKFAKGVANLTLYIAQPAMIINSFIMDYDPSKMGNIVQIAIFSVIAHVLFFGVAMLFFKKVPIDKQKVLRFAIIFSNAGYMGIPLIRAFLGSDAGIYATIYNIGFNLFIWSLGCYIYSGDKKYMSVKKMFINPATISIATGMIIFVTPLSGYIEKLTPLKTCIDYLDGMVAPLVMMLVGFHMASVDWKTVFKDIEMYKCIFLRLILCPVLVWAVLRVLMVFGLCSETAMQVVLVCSATPCATSVGVFAEKFNCDTVTSGKVVPISTILALATMPLIAMLLLI